MAVEISYEEFLADRHGIDHTIQIFPELLLGTLTKSYLWGIGTDHIHSRISNYYPDQDNPVALPSNIYDSILKTEASSCVGTSSSFPPGVTKTRHHNSQGAALKATTKLSIPYFSEVLDSLTPQKCSVIESFGFGSLLLFDKCAIPLPFARWVVDRIRVSSWDIVLKNKSILITPQTVHDVLGIPIGGKTISKASQECGKFAFLRCMNMSSLPSVKVCSDNLLKDNISDDDLVRNFLTVALATFLCPLLCLP